MNGYVHVAERKCIFLMVIRFVQIKTIIFAKHVLENGLNDTMIKAYKIPN